MSQNKLDFSKPNKEKKISKQPYHSPKLYLLGSIETVQAGSNGSRYDGPDRLYYYR